MMAFLVLPPEERRALYAVYSFSRAVDDAVDGDDTLARKRDRLAWWRWRLHEAYFYSQGERLAPHTSLLPPDNPRTRPGKASSSRASSMKSPPCQQTAILQEMAWAVRRFDISQGYFLDLLKGVELDLAGRRYSTFGELEQYCYYVAGTIGLICNAIFGERSLRAESYAVTLGTAFQLTNILRDIEDDWGRGRIYLPKEDLDRFGVTPDDLGARPVPDTVRRLVRFEVQRARGLFRKAQASLTPGQRRRLVAAQIMTGIYYQLLCRVERRCIPLGKETSRLPYLTRARIALGIWVECKSGGRVPRSLFGVLSP